MTSTDPQLVLHLQTQFVSNIGCLVQLYFFICQHQCDNHIHMILNMYVYGDSHDGDNHMISFCIAE